MWRAQVVGRFCHFFLKKKKEILQNEIIIIFVFKGCDWGEGEGTNQFGTSEDACWIDVFHVRSNIIKYEGVKNHPISNLVISLKKDLNW